MLVVCGIDPGLDGALSFIEPKLPLRVAAMIGMPAMKLAKGKNAKREISARTLIVEIEREVISVGLVVLCAYLERVSSSPQMGVTSAFQFGRGYGVIEGVIAALGWPVEYVTPAKWKRALQVPVEKDDARSRACQLLPLDTDQWTPRRLVMTQAQAFGRAEAALISLYGVRDLTTATDGKRVATELFAGAA